MKGIFSAKRLRTGLFVGLFGIPILYATLVLTSTPALAYFEYGSDCPSGWQTFCNIDEDTCYLDSPQTGLCCDVEYIYYCPDTGQEIYKDVTECGAQC